MALQGKLNIGGRDYGVIECEYEFTQTVDETGKPVSRPHGGVITFVMTSTNDDDLFFYKWMFNKTMVHDGCFTFIVFTYDNKLSYKTVSFKNAYCIGLKDFFNDRDSKLMYSTITISAEVIEIGGGARFSNEWV